MSGLPAAWLDALAAEQRAVFGYDVLGPHLAHAAAAALARTCRVAHEQLRDATTAALAVAGVPPPAPPVDYPDLYPVRSSADGELLAVRLEQGAASAWRFAYASAAESRSPESELLRTAAQAALTDSALRATRWRMTSGARTATVAFPGI